MELVDLRAELELEITWRQNEIRFLRNQLAYMRNDQERDRYRKSLVVMLYSHYEGFCKAVFSIYADAINKEKMNCSVVKEPIAAASLSEVFKDFENTQKKSAFFANILPDDTQLHRFARQVEFLEKLKDVWQKSVNISTDIVIDLESNLTPAVLRKILFRLGFPHKAFKHNEGKIHQLLKRRNNIAHGIHKSGISEKEYNEVEEAAYEIMKDLIQIIYTALKNTSYLKNPA